MVEVVVMDGQLFDGRFPVMLTFDVDGESNWLSRDPRNANRPTTLSFGVYGPKVGLARILKLLARYEIKATFFVPGWIIERWKPQISAVVEQGHEIGHHGWLHESAEALGSEEKGWEILEKGTRIIKELTGGPPSGYRAPGAELLPYTISHLVKAGFLYSSNMMDDDSPYFHDLNGQRTKLVELPVQWQLEDSPFFLFSPHVPGRQMYAPSTVLEIWQREFDALAVEPGKCFVLTLHPEHMGRPSRLSMLEEFIRHTLQNGRAWFARCDEVSRAYVEAVFGARAPEG